MTDRSIRGIADDTSQSNKSNNIMAVERQPRERIPTSLVWFAISLVALVRVLVGFQPHSGQGNWHGSKVAYGGDAEAQRHWMEITYHLPMSDWYYHDLHYWGLDYPPLTAYVSQLCGALALAGDVSLLAAFASHEFVAAHEALGRNRPPP